MPVSGKDMTPQEFRKFVQGAKIIDYDSKYEALIIEKDGKKYVIFPICWEGGGWFSAPSPCEEFPGICK